MKKINDKAILLALTTQLDVVTNHRILSGFDGFIDSIIHVVDRRLNDKQYTRIETITDYGNRILAAAGLSTNIEQVVIDQKLGGNGPIFLNALLEMSQHGIYIGALGNPINPIFNGITERAEVISLCEPGCTDALEFNDGKLIISKLSSFNDIDYIHLLKHIDKARLIELVESSNLLSFMNWTMLPFMSDILESFISEIIPQITAGKYVFFDLADPCKRTRGDIKHILAIIRHFQDTCKVILSMNLKEAKQVADALEISGCDDIESLVRYISESLEIFAVVIHPVAEACTVINGDYYHINGPFCKTPKLTTGGGDSFNAGFCLGILHGWAYQQCLAMGIATSGYYVRNGRHGNLSELCTFIHQWSDGNIPG